MKELSIGDFVKGNNHASFQKYREGYLYYKVLNESDKLIYVFPIHISEIDGATLESNPKAILLMRWIRKAISDKTITVSK